MMPDMRFPVRCSCGTESYVTTSQAGADISCAKCQKTLSVPDLRRLKQLGGIDSSPLGQIEHAIDWQDKPFDGCCQSCEASAGTHVLIVLLVASDGEDGRRRAVTLPCYFCEPCAKHFRLGLWLGRLQSLGNSLVTATWMLALFVLTSLLALMLPIIGIAFVISVMSGLLYHLDRRRANPFLLRHLDHICRLKEVLRGTHGYSLKSLRMRRL